MKLFAFCTITVLSLLYAGLTIMETLTYRQWEQAVIEQKDIQAKVAFFQRMNTVLDQMLRRMAIESQHDPALARLLEENKVKVVVNDQSPPSVKSPLGTNTPSAVPPPSEETPLIPDKSSAPSQPSN